MDGLHLLREATLDNCPPLSYDGRVTHAKLLRNYDGDTGDIALLDSAAGKVVRVRVRFVGYDSPEIHPPLHIPDRERVMQRAVSAKQRLWELCTENAIIRVACGKFDKYGRLLVTAFRDDSEGETINAQMIREGHGVPYAGGKRH